jgi:hypothetical protein
MFVREFSISRFLWLFDKPSVIPKSGQSFRPIFQNSKKWKFKEKVINKKPRKYVLIINIVNHVVHTGIVFVIAKNLIEMFIIHCNGAF